MSEQLFRERRRFRRVRRTSITEVARKIQATGAIRYSRGVIKILDFKALKALSCECYETLRKQA
jgi:hypothetical protein